MKYESRADRIFDVINYLLLIIVLVLTAYPLIYIVSASVSDPTAVNSGRMWLWPVSFTLEGYQRLFKNGEIWLGYANTIFYTVFGTLLNLAVTLPCAYAMSRKDFVGRKTLNFMVVFTMFFGGGLIPTYIVVKNLGLLDTRIILLVLGATSSYNLIVTRTFFSSSIPDELRESAFVDGCTNWILFTRIVLPLSKAIIAVMALFFGVTHWNAYFNALVYISTREKYPLQVFLREILIFSEMLPAMLASEDSLVIEELTRQARIAEMVKYGAIIVSSLPVIIAYPLLQRYFVKGVMLGAIKG